MYVNASSVVAVIIPPQLSVEVGIIVTVAEHSSVTSGKLGIRGAIVSFTITF